MPDRKEVPDRYDLMEALYQCRYVVTLMLFLIWGCQAAPKPVEDELDDNREKLASVIVEGYSPEKIIESEMQAGDLVFFAADVPKQPERSLKPRIPDPARAVELHRIANFEKFIYTKAAREKFNTFYLDCFCSAWLVD